MVKPSYQQPIDAKTQTQVLDLFDKMLRLLHPFMPFITEELWQLMADRKTGESIMEAELPISTQYDEKIIAEFEEMKEIVGGIRNIRQEKNIPNKENLSLFVKGDNKLNPAVESVITKLAGLDKLEYTESKIDGSASFLVKSTEFFVPLQGFINVDEEIAKLEEELKYAKGFLASVMKKLGNERFVNSAPAQVVELERRKQADAEGKIKVIEERLAEMRK